MNNPYPDQWFDIAKKEWLPGPWHQEPDLLLENIYKDYRYDLKRNIVGSWCGYIWIPSHHKQYERWFADRDISEDIEVHGGITFREEFKDNKTHEKFIIMGFDCAHFNDVMPASIKLFKLFSLGELLATYKDIDFVKRECEAVIEQLLELDNDH